MAKQTKKKNREFHQIFGINGSSNVIQAKKVNIVRIDIMVGGMAEKKSWVVNLSRTKSLPVHRIPKAQFLKKYPGKRTQGIVVSFQGKIITDVPSFEKLKGNICLLAIDSLEDPQNLGQIIRTAECAGIDGVIIPKHGNVQITNTVFQVTQGAFVHLPIYGCGNLHPQLRTLKSQGFWVVGVENSVQAKNWYELDYQRKLVLVLGSEGKGIRPVILKTCDDVLTIPMQGKLNSLNVSAAVSAVLFERHRQMLQARQPPLSTRKAPSGPNRRSETPR